MTLEALDSAVDVYLNARNVILCYGMGITQHSHGTANVQQLANFLMLRGNIGRRGAGICPLRGIRTFRATDRRNHRDPQRGASRRHGEGLWLSPAGGEGP